MGTIDGLETFERRYLDLRRRLFSERWDFYTLGRTPELDDLSASMFALACEATDGDLPPGRRSDVLRRVLERELVDSHPEVSVLVNRLTAGVGYPDSRVDGITERALVAEADVTELVHRRNAVSRSRGAEDYADFTISLMGLDLNAVRTLVTDIRLESLVAVADRHPDAEPTDPDRPPSRVFDPASGVDEAIALLRQIGLAHLAAGIQWRVDPNGFPYEGPISVPEDVRIMLPETRTIGDVTSAFHELGHAIMHVANAQTGVFLSWNELWDESMAMTMQHIGVALRYDLPSQQTQRRIDERERLRLSTSFLFELDLIADPDEARGSYARWYEAVGDVEIPALWAVDTFRVEDPVHVFTYVIGEIVAHAVVDHLNDRFGDDHRRWGPWLEVNWYRNGRATDLFEKLDHLEVHRPDDVFGLAAS